MMKTLLPLIAAASLSAARAELVLDLDATALSSGQLSEATDKSGGRWKSGSPLRVEKVGGRQALAFDGMQDLVSDFKLPAGFEKSAFTVEAWVLNPSVEKAESLLAFVPEKGGLGTEFGFGSGASAGAFRCGFKATTPFGNLPSPAAWHHLAWTFEGGGTGTLRVYVDGELDAERPLKFVLPPQAKLHVGASGEVDNKGPKSGFSGSIGRVRIQNVALTQMELRAGAGLLDAFAPSPRNGTTTDSLTATLRWQPGVRDAVSFLVYTGIHREAVEKGEHDTAKATAIAELGPLPLQAGAVYFWRVDSLDASGRVVAPGAVWTFTADAGLAAAPQPRDHDSNVTPALAQLLWTPGKYASKQRVYFGATAAELERATTPAAELAAGAAAIPLPAKLSPGTSYAWRIDSDNGAQPPTHGPVWMFRTQDAPLATDVTFFVGSDCHYGRENNAAINRRVIDEMNALPGTPLPASIGGGWVRTPRGVVLNGDLLDEGFNPETAPANWAEFCRDYGLTGSDGRLCFPVYEGFGNHDGGPSKSFVRAGIRERNVHRVGVKTISPSGLHYAWDWDHLHLAQLNLFGGSGPADVKGVNGPEHDPEGSLEFLKKDLAQSVGASGRPVIAFQHFGWLGGMADWWQMQAKERFHEVVRPYNIACLINGHSHGTDVVLWHDLLTIHDGSTARGEADTGDFLVVRVTDKELLVAQRKLGGWGMVKRKALATPVAQSPAP